MAVAEAILGDETLVRQTRLFGPWNRCGYDVDRIVAVIETGTRGSCAGRCVHGLELWNGRPRNHRTT